ncbi:MAG TPA: efflux RND transporter periplasmic adaptor subunit [Terriglobales bacterium]|nr:efflux RND transporter periplasmic adaptor subunit [Terriglobales bacterium]
MSVRNKFLILLSILLGLSAAYYFLSTPGGSDLILVGTVDSNQIVVSPQVGGRIAKLLVEEGTSVKQGDLIAVLDPAELEAQERAAAATISSLRSKVGESQYMQRSTKGSTSSDVVNAQARLQSARAQLAQAEAMLTRVESDSRRIVGLAQAGVASEMEKVQAEQNLKAQQASVQALRDQVHASQADLDSAIARTNQAGAAQSTVASTQGELANAQAQLKEAEVRLGYTKIYAPVTGTVLVRAAREGEVLTAGQAIVTVVDLSDTWVRAAIPETDADHIGLGDTLRVRLPGGTVTPGKVFFKAAEADFATQRDVGRRKRDIRTLVLKVRLDNPKGAYVPGMTAEVLVSSDILKGAAPKDAEAAGKP